MQHIVIADNIRCPKCQSPLGLHREITYCYECKVHFPWRLQRDDDPDAKNALQLVFEMRDGTPPVFAGTLPPATTIQPEEDPDTIPADPVGECDYSDLLPKTQKTHIENPRQTPTPVETQHTPENQTPHPKKQRPSAISILAGTPRPKPPQKPQPKNKSGHKDLDEHILKYLEKKTPATTGEMRQAFGCAKSTLNKRLKLMEKDGFVVNPKRGVWALVE